MGMQIVSARLYELNIPFRNPFTHSLNKSASSSSVILKLITNSGESGFGECVPRPYVTGESISSCFEHIQNVFLPSLMHCDFNVSDDLYEINKLITDKDVTGSISVNAARTAVELALLDCVLKQRNESLGQMIKPIVNEVTYSAVITAGNIDTVRKAALKAKQYGMEYIKIKIGLGDDYQRVAAVREIMGDSVSLRVDANAAFDRKAALNLISLISPLKIDSMEQPIPRGNIRELALLKKESAIPIMADESVVTMDDACRLIENNACDMFNLRISKNGGIFKTIEIAEAARKAGIEVQLGCQVGETSILSAAGRHLAAHLPALKFLEGSYGRLLLESDITDNPVEFGYKGKASLLKGKGLGIDINEDILGKYSKNIITIDMN